MQNLTLLIHLLLLICSTQMCLGQEYESGQIYYGTNDYVSYHAGNLPLIISVPHGGALKPSDISDRSCPNCVVINDTNTKELGISLKNAIEEITGCQLHMIVSELHRSKLDANREISEAALGDQKSELAWNNYHAFIDSAKARILKDWGRGLLIDLHGHGHSLQRLEIGYRISSSQLRMSDSELDNSGIKDDSSIRYLVDSSEFTLSEIIRGESSLGDLFDRQGFDAVPSGILPAPDLGDPYFPGGYIADKYGSKDGSKIDAIQIECHQDIRFNDDERERFADSLAVTLLSYLQNHYFENLVADYCLVTSSIDKQSQSNLYTYPNPACQSIEISTDFQDYKLELYNSLGSRIREFHDNETNVDLGNLENGLYFLQIIGKKGKRFIQKLIIHCN